MSREHNMLEIDSVARKVYETSQVVAEGYRRNISDLNTPEENRAAEQCSIAASNTGYFILTALGFSSDEIKGMRVPGQGSP